MQLGWLTTPLTVGFVLGLADVASAQATAGPHLEFTGCEQAATFEIARLIAIDLGPPAVTPDPNARVTVECQGSAMQLSVPSVALTRRLDFARTPPEARARLAAIVVSELVAEAKSPRPAPPPPPPVVDTAPQDRVEPALRDDHFHLGAALSGRTFFGGVARLIGGGLLVEDSRLPLTFNALAEQGSVTTTEGEVLVQTLSGGLLLLMQEPLGAATARFGAGIRAGAVRMNGRPNDATSVHPHTLWRGWIGPALSTGMSLPTSGASFQFMLEGGYTAWPVYGLVTGEREVGLSGWWLGGQLGVSVAL